VFARPAQVNQRRYEAVRAYLHEGTSLGETAARFGHTRSALACLVRDSHAGKLALFAEPGRPGRKSSPKKDRAGAGRSSCAGRAYRSMRSAPASHRREPA
jgi:hypothetical protein